MMEAVRFSITSVQMSQPRCGAVRYLGPRHIYIYIYIYSKTCLKRNAIVPAFFFPFSQVSVLQRFVF